MSNLCACGCGGATLRTYIHGHNGRGKPHSEEWTRKVSLAQKGIPRGPLSEEARARRRKHPLPTILPLCACGCGQVIHPARPELGGRFIHGHNHRGKPHGEEWVKKISLVQRGIRRRPMTEEERRRNSESKKGIKKPPRTQAHRLALKAARAKMVMPIKDSKSVEIPLQKFLARHGISYEKHLVVPALHPYHQFDIAIPYLKLIIEGNGCYWHACPQCFPSGRHTKFDSEFEIVELRAKKLGWKVLVVWEHEITNGSAFSHLLNTIIAVENNLPGDPGERRETLWHKRK